jgi:predicted nucleotidyltransferase
MEAYVSNRTRKGMNLDPRIPDLANDIARHFLPDRIILFGSHARGEAHRDSDVDLLVVMPLGGKRRHRQTAEIYERCHAGFPVDIVVRTPEEFAEGLRSRDLFLHDIAREGKVLYAA